jgi:mono/diheme cytochrome c family protein
MHLFPRLLILLGLVSCVLLLGACGPGAAPPTATTSAAAGTTVSLPSQTATTVPTAAPTSTVTLAPTAAPLAVVTIEPTASPTTAADTALPGDAANGAKLFDNLPCSSCHDDTHPLPGGVVCPNLGNIASEAARIVKSPNYHGGATDAAGYIRESIVNPNAYIVPGDNYHTADGQSAMEKDFAKTLTHSQIDDLVAYLMTKQ